MSNKQNFQINSFGSEALWLVTVSNKNKRKMGSLQFRNSTFVYIITTIFRELIILHLFYQ